MSALDSVGELTVIRTGDIVAGSYFSVAPDLAVSAGHVFVAYDPLTNTISDFVSGSVSTASASINGINYLRNYDVRQNAKTPSDPDYGPLDINFDIVTFDLSGGQFSTTELVGLGVFLDANDYVARQVTSAGYPGPALVTKNGAIDTIVSHTSAASGNLDIQAGMSGGPALFSTLQLVGVDEEFAIGINAASVQGDLRP